MKAEEFRKKREQLGYSQTKLAEVLGLKLRTIARYEGGETEIPRAVELCMLRVITPYGKKGKS